jgi:hypothetical protein
MKHSFLIVGGRSADIDQAIGDHDSARRERERTLAASVSIGRGVSLAGVYYLL